MRAKIGALMAAVAAAASAAGATVWARRRKGAAGGGAAGDEPARASAQAPAAEAQAQPAAAAAAPTPEPEAAPADAGAVDELTAIKGLGSVSVGRLHEIGVTTFAQIAGWGDEDIDEVGTRIHISPERIRREDWVGQARAKLEG